MSLILNEANAGPVANFETARRESQGEYFMWLGDDDWIDDQYLSSCVRELRRDPSTAMVAGVAHYHADDRDWLDSPTVDAIADDPRERVLSYFRQVGSNGVFYGVVRQRALDLLPPLTDHMGGDWTHVASLAFLGRIRTIDSVQVHRSVGGATRSLADVARHQQLGWIARTAPQLVIAWVVFSDIAWRSPVYAPLGSPGRVRLGLHAAWIVSARFLPGAIAKFARIQISRLRARRAVTPTTSGHHDRAMSS